MKNLLTVVLSFYAVSTTAKDFGDWSEVFSNKTLYLCAIEMPFKDHPKTDLWYLDFSKDPPGLYQNQSFHGNNNLRHPLMEKPNQGFFTHTFSASNLGVVFELDPLTFNKNDIVTSLYVEWWSADETNNKLKGYCELTPDILFN